jgi:hypothetical protein
MKQFALKIHYFSDILVPPEEVTILGDKTVRADRSVSYQCLASNANPAPIIEWSINGQLVSAGVNTSPAKSGRRSFNTAKGDQAVNGWSVSSTLNLDVTGDDSRISLRCQSISRDHLGQTMTATEELEVLVLSKLKSLKYF